MCVNGQLGTDGQAIEWTHLRPPRTRVAPFDTVCRNLTGCFGDLQHLELGELWES